MRTHHSHLISALALGAALLASLSAQAADAMVARGLIVTLKAPADGGRESPQATRERLKAVESWSAPPPSSIHRARPSRRGRQPR